MIFLNCKCDHITIVLKPFIGPLFPKAKVEIPYYSTQNPYDWPNSPFPAHLICHRILLHNLLLVPLLYHIYDSTGRILTLYYCYIFHPSTRLWALWRQKPCLTSAPLPPGSQWKFNICQLTDRPWSIVKTNSYPELFLLPLNQNYLSRKTFIFITIFQQPKEYLPTAST